MECANNLRYIEDRDDDDNDDLIYTTYFSLLPFHLLALPRTSCLLLGVLHI